MQIADLFDLDLPKTLKAHVIAQIPHKSFSMLDDDLIVSLFEDPDGQVRKVSVIKSIVSLSRRRVDGLMKRYVDGSGHRFYNVVFWLDFGTSVAISDARKAAARLLDFDDKI